MIPIKQPNELTGDDVLFLKWDITYYIIFLLKLNHNNKEHTQDQLEKHLGKLHHIIIGNINDLASTNLNRKGWQGKREDIVKYFTVHHKFGLIKTSKILKISPKTIADIKSNLTPTPMNEYRLEAYSPLYERWQHLNEIMQQNNFNFLFTKVLTP